MTNDKWKMLFRLLPLISTLLCTPVLAQESLPDTLPLTTKGDLAEQMVEGINNFLFAGLKRQ